MKFPRYDQQRALVLGLGTYEQGSGIAAAEFLLRSGAHVCVSDRRPAANFHAQLRRLQKYRSRLCTRFGSHNQIDADWATMIVKHPAVPAALPLLTRARQQKKPIETDISLWLKYYTGCWYAITGSKGKSTAAALLAFLLRQHYRSVYLAGNIGQSPLAFWQRLTPASRVVVELSSWQLHDLGNVELRPAGAILTSLYPDHLNTYQNFAAYTRDKARLFRDLTPAEWAIFPDMPAARAIAKQSKARTYYFSSRLVQGKGLWSDPTTMWLRWQQKSIRFATRAELNAWSWPQLGNVLAASLGALAAGVPKSTLRNSYRHLPQLPGRCQRIAVKRGVAWYNDTTATIPEATGAALQRFAGQRVHLICGGQNKGLHYAALTKLIRRQVASCLLLPGDVSEQLAAGLRVALQSSGRALCRVQTMAGAVRVAARLARPGDVVLLSPGAASFASFKNEFDRGDQFNTAVKRLASR